MAEKSTFRLNKDKLATLWTLGSRREEDHGPANEDVATAELLATRLDGPLPFDSAVTGMLSACTGKSPNAISSMSIRDALLDPQASLNILEAIKEFAKRMSTTGGVPGQSAAIAIYYGAIASVQVFHNKNITSHSHESLREAYGILLEKHWLSDDLAHLFTRAKHLCDEKP